MSSAQSWTLIGGFLAILVAMSGLVLRIVQLEVAALGESLRGEMRVGFVGLQKQLDSVENDVQRLFVKIFPASEAE